MSQQKTNRSPKNRCFYRYQRRPKTTYLASIREITFKSDVVFLFFTTRWENLQRPLIKLDYTLRRTIKLKNPYKHNSAKVVQSFDCNTNEECFIGSATTIICHRIVRLFVYGLYGECILNRQQRDLCKTSCISSAVYCTLVVSFNTCGSGKATAQALSFKRPH